MNDTTIVEQGDRSPKDEVVAVLPELMPVEKGAINARKAIRAEAARLFQEFGDTKYVAEKLNVPLRTVQHWASKDGWKENGRNLPVPVTNGLSTFGEEIKSVQELESEEEIYEVRKKLAAGLRGLIRRHFKIDPDGNIDIENVKLRDIKNFKEAYQLYKEIVGIQQPDPGPNGKVISATLVIKRGR